MAHRRKANAVKLAQSQRIVVGVEDMVLLQNIRDDGIMENLKERLEEKQIYTYIGNVLVACNPYTWLQIYDEATMRSYVHQARVDMAPHIFATAEAAYRSMVTEEESQCVIISGESGAGKTEASKHIQQYIAAISSDGDGVDKIKRIFLESNPVLEAFGNAKTLRNNNSSRFGKYFELKFTRFGRPLGGVITNYLLEKSRIVHAGDGERNFHIFYQLMKSRHTDSLFLKGMNPTNFAYLARSRCFDVDGVDDAKEFDHTMAAMQAVGLGDKQIHAILNLIACILHLGNVQFRAKQIENAEGSEITPQSMDNLSKFCDLVQCDINVMQHVLCFRELQTMSPGGKIDTYQVPQNPIQAASRRDAVAKSIYERLFDMIVARINVALDPEKAAHPDGRPQDFVDEQLSIGVLDIYGFEIFENNGFEQLCINYVNEKLQQIFIELTLRAEQDEYKSEGIEWTPIPFFNNRIVCELLDSTRPPGIFRILDDTCKTLHGREVAAIDKKFIESASQVHSGHAHFSQSSGAIFTIRHYAGDVTYTAGMFGESNKDALNKDMIAAVKQSRDRLIQYLFPEEIDLDDKKAPPTAGTRIRTQCQSLVTALMECSPHYVRCIKSNDVKRALNMNNDRVKHQVKYLGLAENIKVRRAGFAYRAEYHRFFERFNILCKDTYPNWHGSDKDGCIRIVNWICSEKKLPALAQRGEVQYGKSKIFIRQPETYFGLERLRETGLSNFVLRIQKAWRSHHNLREYIILNRNLAKLYADERKTRRKDSIYRPFQGDYLNSLKNHEDIRDGLYNIIESFSENESIVFADASCAQVVSDKNAASKWALAPRIVVLTNEALYLFEISHPAMPDVTAYPTKNFPKVFLRRRVSYASGQGLESIFLTRSADPCIGLAIASTAKPKEPDQSHWVPDASAIKCGITGTPFSLFTRRHHCRACGGIFTQQACDFAAFLPDRGWDSMTKICDLCIGTFNTAPMEDIMIVCARRSEIVSSIRTQYEKFNSKGGKGRNAELRILFGSSFRMRPTEYVNSSLRPADEINFVDGNPPPRSSTKRSPGAPRAPPPQTPAPGSAQWQQGLMEETGIIDISLSSAGGRNVLNITCAHGLPHELVEDRRKRQLKRQKAAEARRHAEDEQRRHMAAVKLAEREADRLERLREKKARKAEEKQAKRQAEEEKEAAMVAKRAQAVSGGPRKFGSKTEDAPTPRAAAPPQPPAASGGNGLRPAAPPKPGAPPSRPGAVPVASGGMSELQAAMARRRNANG